MFKHPDPGSNESNFFHFLTKKSITNHATKYPYTKRSWFSLKALCQQQAATKTKMARKREIAQKLHRAHQ